MKKLVLVTLLAFFTQLIFAGGLLTNYNQSVQYARMMSRNASFDIDAIFFNPAGLAFMENGWHFALHNQSIWQDKTTVSKFPLLNREKYVGKVFAPIFPDVYAVYKMDKWAFSFGFNPVGGGGSAEYSEGIPSFEIPLSKLPAALQGLTQIDPALKVDGYDVDLSFDGSSIFWGLQLGATYKINEKFSVFGGVRYIPAANTYNGSIENIQLKIGGKLANAKDWMQGVAGNLSGLATKASAGATMLGQTAASLQLIIDANAGGYTLAQLEGASQISAQQKAQLEGALQQLGLSSEEIGAMNVTTIQGTFSTYQQKYSENAVKLNKTAGDLNENASQLGNKKVETKQTGSAFTPIIGLNYRPNENFVFAVKYEMQTKLTLTNDTKVDDLGLFPDGAKVENDIPAHLAVGIGYKTGKLDAQFSFNHFFDKSIDTWGLNTRDAAIYGSEHPKTRKREIDKNLWEIGVGAEYSLTDKLAISAGGLYGETGVARSYQSDLSNSNSSATVAGGFEWKITDTLTFDAGMNYTFYKEEIAPFKDPNLGNYNEIYDKTAFVISAGVSYSIFK